MTATMRTNVDAAAVRVIDDGSGGNDGIIIDVYIVHS
jgi:hypothetical protein